jgi:DNA-binding MarR family transcriptional regulator
VVDARDLGPRLAGRLTYLLKRTLVRLEALQDEALAPAGITGRELGLLLALEGREPASQQEVANRLGVDRTSMVAYIDRLEAKGLVTRRADPADRRRNVVELTDAGTAAVDAGVRASDEAEARLLDALSAREAAGLRALLGRLDG